MKNNFKTKFLENRDETGRLIVYSFRTGVSYYVEPIGDGRGGDWGSENPATKQIEHKKGDGKYTGSITEKESMITEQNGFEKDKTHLVDGSYDSVISELDAKYPTKIKKDDKNN